MVTTAGHADGNKTDMSDKGKWFIIITICALVDLRHDRQFRKAGWTACWRQPSFPCFWHVTTFYAKFCECSGSSGCSYAPWVAHGQHIGILQSFSTACIVKSTLPKALGTRLSSSDLVTQMVHFAKLQQVTCEIPGSLKLLCYLSVRFPQSQQTHDVEMVTSRSDRNHNPSHSRIVTLPWWLGHDGRLTSMSWVALTEEGLDASCRATLLHVWE